MALTVIDASVLIALLDGDDLLHEGARAALLKHEDDDLGIPASAYSEALVDPARKGRLAAARAAVTALQLNVHPLDRRTAEEAAALRARHFELRLPDALVIATGVVLEAATILTGDVRWRRINRSVEVVTA